MNEEYTSLISGQGIVANPYGDLINRYQVNRPDYESNENVNDALVIPPTLDKVLKKTISGLEEISIKSYERKTMYNPVNFLPTYRYLVNLVLTFAWNTETIYSCEKLKEIINTSFSMMYTDIDNYRFNVIKVNTKERDFDKEFFEFFMKK